MDLHLTAALAALALLAAAPTTPDPKAAGAPAPPPMTWSEAEGNPGVPQRGTPADLAVWRSMQSDLHQTLAQRGLAHRLYYRLRPEREDAALVALAKERPALAPKVEALRKRLQAARQTHFALMSMQWPVDPRRGCRAEMLDMTSAMEALPGQAAGATLQAARDDARRCTEKLRSVLVPLREANLALQAAVDEVDKLLPAVAAPGAPAAAGSAEAPGPAQAAKPAPGQAPPTPPEPAKQPEPAKGAPEPRATP